MNSSATRAHLLCQLDGVSSKLARHKSVAARKWRTDSVDVRMWHVAQARVCLSRMARLELAVIYLGLRMERAR